MLLAHLAACLVSCQRHEAQRLHQCACQIGHWLVCSWHAAHVTAGPSRATGGSELDALTVCHATSAESTLPGSRLLTAYTKPWM